MALNSITVVKQSVNQNMKGQYSVVWELKGFDESEIELFSQTFNEDYKKGDDISRIKAGFIEQMQDYINKYKKEQQLLTAVVHDEAVINVQTVLEV